jgi:hypothetical protein
MEEHRLKENFQICEKTSNGFFKTEKNDVVIIYENFATLFPKLLRM